MSSTLDLLEVIHPGYARVVDLGVTTAKVDHLYSVKLSFASTSSDSFAEVAAAAESTSTAGIVVCFDKAQNVEAPRSFGSTPLTTALRSQNLPVKFIAIHIATGYAVISYNAPEDKLEWETSVVRAYDEEGRELAGVNRVTGWMRRDGRICLIDPTQPVGV